MSHTMYQIYSPADFSVQPWRNGQGSTVELIAQRSKDAGEFIWRLSMADVNTDGPFSNFAGYDRTLLLLKGMGITLDHSNGNVDELTQPLQAAHFQGEAATVARLHGSAITDFNVITQRNRCTATVQTSLEGETKLPVRGDIVFLYAVDQAVTVHTKSWGEIVVDNQHLLHTPKTDDKPWIINGGPCITVQIHYKPAHS